MKAIYTLLNIKKASRYWMFSLLFCLCMICFEAMALFSGSVLPDGDQSVKFPTKRFVLPLQSVNQYFVCQNVRAVDHDFAQFYAPRGDGLP